MLLPHLCTLLLFEHPRLPQNVTELVGRLRATSDLHTRFLQTKTALKSKSAELAAANEALRSQRQAAELAQLDVSALKQQLRYDTSAAELRRLKDSEAALKGEKEQLALKLAVRVVVNALQPLQCLFCLVCM